MELTKCIADTASLMVAYEQTGPDSGQPIVLLHGFPYDVRQYDAMRDRLAGPDRRIIVLTCAVYGPTRYRTPQIVRSGQQAALGKDVIDLLDAIGVQKPSWLDSTGAAARHVWRRLSGRTAYADWCRPAAAMQSKTFRKRRRRFNRRRQWYFHTRQSEIGLENNREEFCKFLWKLWSPTWEFTDAEYARTAESFQNPDFVATVIQSYRHRYANAPGDPALENLEVRLARQPAIAVPSIALQRASDQVEPPSTGKGHEEHFTAGRQRHIPPGVGHCLPAEAPRSVSEAVELLLRP